jgi:hypothetical protein
MTLGSLADELEQTDFVQQVRLKNSTTERTGCFRMNPYLYIEFK